jgi:rsbT co-antagonist protein RsbR
MSAGSPDSNPSLLAQMHITETELQRRMTIAGLSPDDMRRVTMLSDLITRHIDEFTNAFFGYLAALDEGAALTQNKNALERARRLKKEHLQAMSKGSYGLEYAEQRLRLGQLYASVGLTPRVFLGGFRHLIGTIAERVMAEARDPREAFTTLQSLEKVAALDISFIVDVIVSERERVIGQQQEALRELSTPVLQIRDRLLILPIIGVIDTQRARQLTESLLHAIRTHRAKVVVVDITGVPVVDSKVANHLMQAVMAARLMGASAIVTGLSSEVAQALVTLGVDLRDVTTAGDLQGGLEDAERALGYTVVRLSSPNQAGS